MSDNSFYLPIDYIIDCFFRYTKNGKKLDSNKYNASCPICKEGNHPTRKRLYYIINNNNNSYFYCHNCGKSWNPVNWIMEVSGDDFRDILKESKTVITDVESYQKLIDYDKEHESDVKIINTDLPKDYINLFDNFQLSHHLNNKIIQDALSLINKRRLNTAINRPKALYISLNDYVHRNRLCIPFYNHDNQCTFYQSRAIYKEDALDGRKYLSKLNADKTIYGLNNITDKNEYLFIFEGPIDAMFVKGGIAVGGIKISKYQQELLNPYMLCKKIWVLDNQYIDKTAKENSIKLLENGENVFIWPNEFKKYKDLNEVCIEMKLDEVSPKFFIKNTYTKHDGLIKLSLI